jgi:predicted nucleic acid-binding protein
MIVIADSSALVALSICDGLHLLDDLFCVVKVPQAVYDEVCVMHKAQSHALQFYLQSKVCDVSSVIPIEKSNELSAGKLEPLLYTNNSQRIFY